MTTSRGFARNGRRRAAIVLVGLAAIAGPLSTATTAAQEPPSETITTDVPDTDLASEAAFAVQPSGPSGPGGRDWFTYTLDPGATFGDTVAISNLSDRPVRFSILPTDAESVIDVGGFAALRDDETPVGVGTWITLAAQEYTVPAGQRIDVPFSITVPDDAEPGDHAGAILAVDADSGSFDPNKSTDGLSFNVRNRLGARVYVRVSGPVQPALRIDALDIEHEGNTATITWEVTNTGNLRLAPTAVVRVTGLFGRTVRTMPAQSLPELLPGGNFVGASVVPDLPSLEPLTAHLVLTAPEVRIESSKVFESYPWLLMSALLVVLALVARWWRRRRRRAHAPTGPRSPRSPRALERVSVGA